MDSDSTFYSPSSILHMNFTTDFFWHSVLAALVASVWFILPGLTVLRLLGFLKHARSVSTLLLAPAVGLCTYGPFSLAVTTLFGYSPISLFASWLLFLILFGIWSRRRNARFSEASEDGSPLSPLHIFLLLAGTASWSIMATIHLYPFMEQEGLFVDTPIFDHAKVAIVDAIARQGLLPINPYYAPEGQTIPLIYYYTWHFLASQLKFLVEVTGWQAEVAFNWFTGFATLSFLSALAIRFTQRPLAGFLVILFALGGPPTDFLAPLFGPHLQNWFALPPGHGLEVLWIQMMWVPQHVYSALAVVVLLWLASQMFSNTDLPLPLAVVTGLTGAAAFGASTWVGGIGLVMVSPVLLWMMWRLRLPTQTYVNASKAIGLAFLVCLLVALPLLISQASGPSLADSRLPFGIGLYPATRFLSRETHWDLLGHAILFWVQFLPLNLGIIYILGLLALFSRTSSFMEEKVFHYLSMGATLGYLLITQLVPSTFWNNSFGWRAVLVPVLLLLIYSAIAMTELASCHLPNLSKWRPHSLLVRFQPLVQPLTVVGLTIGILSTVQVWRLPDPKYAPPPPEVLARHQGFYRQSHAWAKVREYAGPTDRVQSNPDGYATLTPWPATLPYALFADRPTAYANVEYSTVFAYRYDQAKNQQQYQLIQNIFSTQPALESLRKVRDDLKVKVILVDRFDPVWQTDTIERSGIFRLAYQEVDFKIYVAPPI